MMRAWDWKLTLVDLVSLGSVMVVGGGRCVPRWKRVALVEACDQ